MKEYTLYKGEEILASGTASEIAEKMNVQVSTIMYYQTRTYEGRTSEEKGRRLVSV